jgi:PAS domain S-box-containing protein
METRDSALLFSDVFYKSPVVLTISTPYDGRIIDVNEAFIQSSEYTRDEAIGKTGRELGLFAELKDRDRMIDLLKKDNQLLGYECGFRTKSGRQIFGLVSVVMIRIGNETYQLTTVIDIDQRISAENKISDQFKELRRWHEATLNREKRIMELKREVNDLMIKNGMEIRYASVVEEPSQKFPADRNNNIR